MARAPRATLTHCHLPAPLRQAVHPLNCAHTEALAAKHGVGLVKLMGR